MYIVEQCTDPNLVLGRRGDYKRFKWEYFTRLNCEMEEAKILVERYMLRTGYSYRISDWYGAGTSIIMQVSRRPPRQWQPNAQPAPNLWANFNFPL